MKRVLLIALIVGLVVLPVIGASAKTYKIGYACMTLQFTWMTYAYQAILDTAAQYPDIQLVVNNAEGDGPRQVAIMEDFIAQHFDAILVNPLDVNILNPVLEEAHAAGIPVVTFDRRAVGAPVLFHVGADDTFGERLAVEYIAAKLDGVGKIVSILGQSGSSPAINRENGMKAELAHYPGLQIVYEQSGQFARDQGLSVMEDAITATGGKFDAVICANDDSALGAIQALIDAGIDPASKIVIGYDGVPDGLRAVQSGQMHASIQYPVAMASTAMRELCEYVLHGTIPAQTDFDIMPWLLVKANLSTQAEMYSGIQ